MRTDSIYIRYLMLNVLKEVSVHLSTIFSKTFLEVNSSDSSLVLHLFVIMSLQWVCHHAYIQYLNYTAVTSFYFFRLLILVLI